MLREPLGKYKVAVCEYDTNYIDEKSKGNETDNGVKTYCYTDGTLLSEKEKYPVVIYSHGLKGFQMELI